MLKKSLMLFLVSAVLYAQQSPSAASQQPCPDANQLLAGPGFNVNQHHDLLRRSRTEDFAVVLCSPRLAYGGCDYQNHPPQNGILPLSFSIDLPVGIRASYRNGRRYVPLSTATPAKFTSKSGVLLLRLTAGDNMPLGVQRLHGTLRYETNEPGKPHTTQVMEIDFPLTVVDHDARTAENEWPYGNHLGQHVKDVVLAPLLPFQFLLFVIVCSTSTCDV